MFLSKNSFRDLLDLYIAPKYSATLKYLPQYRITRNQIISKSINRCVSEMTTESKLII